MSVAVVKPTVDSPAPDDASAVIQNARAQDYCPPTDFPDGIQEDHVPRLTKAYNNQRHYQVHQNQRCHGGNIDDPAYEPDDQGDVR